MKTLTLSDKTTVQVDDVSTVNEIVVTTTAEKSGDIFSAIKPGNLTAVSIGDDSAREVIFERGTFTTDGENITLHFFNRNLTTEEELQRRVNDLEDVVATMSEAE